MGADIPNGGKYNPPIYLIGRVASSRFVCAASFWWLRHGAVVRASF
jgi:hypothetical protein